MVAFQSFPSRPKAKRLKLASKVTHGEVSAGIARCKRETRVSALNMVGKEMGVVEAMGNGRYSSDCSLDLSLPTTRGCAANRTSAILPACLEGTFVSGLHELTVLHTTRAKRIAS